MALPTDCPIHNLKYAVWADYCLLRNKTVFQSVILNVNERLNALWQYIRQLFLFECLLALRSFSKKLVQVRLEVLEKAEDPKGGRTEFLYFHTLIVIQRQNVFFIFHLPSPQFGHFVTMHTGVHDVHDFEQIFCLLLRLYGDGDVSNQAVLISPNLDEPWQEVLLYRFVIAHLNYELVARA